MNLDLCLRIFVICMPLIEVNIFLKLDCPQIAIFRNVRCPNKLVCRKHQTISCPPTQINRVSIFCAQAYGLCRAVYNTIRTHNIWRKTVNFVYALFVIKLHHTFASGVSRYCWSVFDDDVFEHKHVYTFSAHAHHSLRKCVVCPCVVCA